MNGSFRSLKKRRHFCGRCERATVHPATDAGKKRQSPRATSIAKTPILRRDAGGWGRSNLRYSTVPCARRRKADGDKDYGTETVAERLVTRTCSVAEPVEAVNIR
jgi:ribosomal protein L44E